MLNFIIVKQNLEKIPDYTHYDLTLKGSPGTPLFVSRGKIFVRKF